MSNSTTVCSVCGARGAVAVTEQRQESYRQQTGRVTNHFHHCATCGSDYATAADMRENKRSVILFRKSVDAIPLGCEIRAMRLSANLSQADAGKLFGGGPVAFSKYEADDLVPDGAMVNLLKLAIAYPKVIDMLKRLAGSHVRIEMHRSSLYVPEVDLGREWHIENQFFSPDLRATTLSTRAEQPYEESNQWKM